MLTVAELTMSRSGTVEICMAHDLGTAIAEIIFGRLLCSSFGTLGLRSWVWVWLSLTEGQKKT